MGTLPASLPARQRQRHGGRLDCQRRGRRSLSSALGDPARGVRAGTGTRPASLPAWQRQRHGDGALSGARTTPHRHGARLDSPRRGRRLSAPRRAARGGTGTALAPPGCGRTGTLPGLEPSGLSRDCLDRAAMTVAHAKSTRAKQPSEAQHQGGASKSGTRDAIWTEQRASMSNVELLEADYLYGTARDMQSAC